jgi:uncharacterized membrane protein YidH (DUF202 family)
MARAKTVSDDYRVLNGEKIIDTIDQLSKRIDERFAGSGLFKVCRRLHEIASQAQRRSTEIARPLWSVRSLTIAVVVVIVGVALVPLALLHWQSRMTLEQFVQVLDSGMNVVVIVGAAILFLVTLESRIKRRRALAAIHEIRSIAHIIDMHQLTKDPERVKPGVVPTESSPKLAMTPFQLSRYLDYCSEMLSLTGKVATLYVQHFDDAVAVASANEIEQLCASLSGKIWQKIVVLEPATPVVSPKTT